MRFAVVVLLAATPVMLLAQDPPTSTHEQAALELMDAMHVERSLKEAMDIMVSAQVQADPTLRPYQIEVRGFFAKYFSWDELRNDYARLYAETFSEEDLRQLTAFYRTELGQKLIGAMPEIMQKGAEMGQAKLRDHAGELREMLQRRAEELKRPKEPE